MKKLLGAIFTSAFLSVGLVMNTQSAVVVNALDTGGDVVFSVAPGGSLDLTGTTLLPSTTGGAGFINPSPL